MKRKSLLKTAISVVALAVSVPAIAEADRGYGGKHAHKAQKHHKHHYDGHHRGYKRGHAYGHYKHKHHRPHHRHGHYRANYYYPAYQPIMGFMYYLDQKDTYYDRYGYN